jgi:transcription antitermination factor NusG
MTERAETHSPWFALHIKSNFEKVTATILTAKGLDVYFPTFRSRRRWSDRVKEIDQPLFPGYLFCRFDPNHRLPILVTPGVLSIVGVAKTPAPIEEDEIQAVRRIIDSGLAARPWPFLHAGQHVRIEKGPLAGTEGILLELKNRYRIVISISLLQRSIAAEIDIDMVRATHSSPARQGLVSFNEAT